MTQTKPTTRDKAITKSDDKNTNPRHLEMITSAETHTKSKSKSSQVDEDKAYNDQLNQSSKENIQSQENLPYETEVE